METCIESFIKDEVLRKKPLHSNQYACREGVSAEPCMRTFASLVETHLELGNYAVAVFMDVEGAFSQTSPQIICEKATSRGVQRPVVDWMMDLLWARKIGDC